MGLADVFYSAFPEAKVVFLYRNAEPWGRSFLRLRAGCDPSAPVPLAHVRGAMGLVGPRLESCKSASYLQLLAWTWLSIMERCLEMQRRGIPMFIARYEELSSAPRSGAENQHLRNRRREQE